MRKLFSLLLITLLLLLFSCDPPHTIEFINKGDSDLKIIFEIDTTVFNNDLDYLKNKTKDSIILIIKKRDTAEIHFGIGTWADFEIKKQAEAFQKLIIINQDFTTEYKSKEGIEKFLRKHRKKGFGLKTKLSIEIE